MNNESIKHPLRKKLSSWLISHPEVNPYKLSLSNSFRNYTAKLRMLPDFIIIGGAKCGTTSLFSYILNHPQVNSPTLKEISFFEHVSKTNKNWYRSHFPLKKSGIITGEATPAYLVHPFAPERISNFIPNVKLIILLRNPIDRAYSAFNYMVNLGAQITDDFEYVIEQELKRIKILEESPINEINEKNFDYTLTFSYLRHGIYVNYIKNWLKFFPKNQIHIIHTQELNKNTDKILSDVFTFLNLPNHEINFNKSNQNIRKIFVQGGKEFDSGKKMNVQHYEKMDEKLQKKLKKFYEPYNEELFNLLGKRFDWS